MRWVRKLMGREVAQMRLLAQVAAEAASWLLTPPSETLASPWSGAERPGPLPSLQLRTGLHPPPPTRSCHHPGEALSPDLRGPKRRSVGRPAGTLSSPEGLAPRPRLLGGRAPRAGVRLYRGESRGSNAASTGPRQALPGCGLRGAGETRTCRRLPTPLHSRTPPFAPLGEG